MDTLLATVKALLAAGAALAVLYAIVTKLGYGHKPFAQEHSRLSSIGAHVLQVNDLGQFWDREAATKALDSITNSAENTNTIVVIFIHGWHHNAKPDDRDATSFAQSLVDIETTLTSEQYRRSREHLTGDGNVKVIGVYIGWRGRSLPGYLDYATFWTRKAAAERVGQGDVRDFLLRLQHLYGDRNTSGSDKKRPFMGLVGIGHSFGGQVLFRAVETTLENELIKATGPRRGHTAVPSDTLSGFGDLVVLLNPALEALQYQTIHELSHKVEYLPSQAPVLLVMSATNDSARLVFFPLGRALYTLFSPWLRAEQIRLSTQALGTFKPQRTHNVEVLDSSTEQGRFDPAWYVEKPREILNYDLSNVPTIAGLRLQPTGSPHAFNPFLVAHVDSRVLVKHSGIYGEALRRFLVDYVAITQGKRILARYDPTNWL